MIVHRYTRHCFAEHAAAQQPTPHRAVFRPVGYPTKPFTIEKVEEKKDGE